MSEILAPDYKWVLGIDPGLTGAIAFFKHYENSDFMPELIGCRDMPTMPAISGKGNIINSYELFHLMSAFHGFVELAIIEQVGPMPTDSRPAAFKLGKAAMAPEVICAVLKYPVAFKTPGAWKRKAGLLKKDKSASRAKATTMWPEKANLFKRKKDDGRAEAALIGHYGYIMANE